METTTKSDKPKIQERLVKLLFSSGICTSGTSNFSDPGVWKEGEKAFDKIIRALSNRADRERTSGKYEF